jgi:recombination protein RecA
MSEAKRRRIENVVASVQQRYGPQALRRGGELDERRAPPHLSTGFSNLDAITGCGGAPLGEITLLSGHSTSGKLTLAYKLLADGQRTGLGGRTVHTVALLDLARTADPDYAARCGLDLNFLLVGRPVIGRQTVEMIGDLMQSRKVRVLVVDSLADLTANQAAAHALDAMLPHLRQLVRISGCALIFLEEPQAPWLRWLNLDASRRVRWAAALHIEMRREQWLRRRGELVGYRAQAHVLKSQWRQKAGSAAVEITFNGTVKASGTW